MSLPDRKTTWRSLPAQSSSASWGRRCLALLLGLALLGILGAHDHHEAEAHGEQVCASCEVSKIPGLDTTVADGQPAEFPAARASSAEARGSVRVYPRLGPETRGPPTA